MPAPTTAELVTIKRIKTGRERVNLINKPTCWQHDFVRFEIPDGSFVQQWEARANMIAELDRLSREDGWEIFHQSQHENTEGIVILCTLKREVRKEAVPAAI